MPEDKIREEDIRGHYMFIAWMYYYCRELEGETLWAAVENGCQKAKVAAPDKDSTVRAKEYRVPASPPVNPFFHDTCAFLDTQDVTEGEIRRSEQIFGPMHAAATEITTALSKVPFEPVYFEFSSEIQISPPEWGSP